MTLAVLVHEFVTGGGWPEPALPPGLADEALAMLRAALADFMAWGNGRVVTTLDTRLAGVDLPAHEIVSLTPTQHPAELRRLAAACDAALVIAPETGGTLARLTSLVEQAGAVVLGSGLAAIAVAADKWACYGLFQQAGLPTPATWRTSAANAVAVARQNGLPLVLKPVDGVGCDGVTLITDETLLVSALSQPVFRQGDLLLQRYIPGVHASVSLLVTAEAALPLSVNEQFIRVGAPFIYQGGCVPLAHPLAKTAANLARQAVGLIPGLAGYVGVDLVLANTGCYLIEINPRLTTTYTGLRQIININLAQAIFNACTHNRLPPVVQLSGGVSFDKRGWVNPAPTGRAAAW
jgi:hypothetical protein